MAAQNLISGAFLTENAVFQDLDPLLRIKKCDKRAKPLKTESPITYSSKILHTFSSLYFWTLPVHKKIFYFTKSPPKHSKYTVISSKASKMSI